MSGWRYFIFMSDTYLSFVCLIFFFVVGKRQIRSRDISQAQLRMNDDVVLQGKVPFAGVGRQLVGEK